MYPMAEVELRKEENDRLTNQCTAIETMIDEHSGELASLKSSNKCWCATIRPFQGRYDFLQGAREFCQIGTL